MASVLWFKKPVRAVLLLCMGGLLTACAHDSAAYLYTGLRQRREEQKTLVSLFLKEREPQLRFAYIDKIAHNLQTERQFHTAAVFLQTVVGREPDNPYNAYLLLRLAAAYRAAHEDKLAAHYFEYIIQNYSDMLVQGQSIHLICLKQLIELSPESVKQTVYYSRLLTDFYDQFDPAHAYFMLAQAYEKQGEWRSAIQAYTQFLNLRRFDVVIQGVPDAYGYARKIVDYSASKKNWTFNTLDELVKIVTAAIRAQNYATLERCRSIFLQCHGSRNYRIRSRSLISKCRLLCTGVQYVSTQRLRRFLHRMKHICGLQDGINISAHGISTLKR